MGKARVGKGGLLAAALVGSMLGTAPVLAAQSRFLSYSSEGECIAGRMLDAALCRSAFANARTEFVARTSSFTSLAQCAKAYGVCAPWPPGTSSRASFRPRWDGVDIVDTPREKTVTPAMSSGLKRLSFAPQPLTEFRSLDVRGPRAPAGLPATAPGGRPAMPPTGRVPIQHAFRGAEPAVPAGPSPAPPPGSGFKLEDGVLTYPAPARFLPKNLPKRP